MKFTLYYHKSLDLARYVRAYSHLQLLERDSVAKVEFATFPQQNAHSGFAELPAALRRLLTFAKPDVVICFDDGVRPVFPIFAFEATEHVPAQDHWLQRFMNLVGAAQERVPGAYIMPFEMPNHPTFPGSLDSTFFYAYDRVMEIHEVPMYIADWETIDGHTLTSDSRFPGQPDSNAPSIKRAFQFLRKVIDAAIHGRDISSLRRDREIVELRNEVRRRGYQKIPQISDFRRLVANMPEGRMLTNGELKKWIAANGLRLPEGLPDRILKRDRHLIYRPQVERKEPQRLRNALLDRIEKRGGDPYTPQPLAFDYLFCRLGPTPYERDASIVIDLSVLRFGDLAKFPKEIWQKSPLQYTSLSDIRHIPTYTMHLTEGFSQVIKNFVRVYAFAADIIVFSDGLLYF